MMGLLGSALGRMAYGAGQLANRYIDEELATQRAQALEEIRNKGAMALDSAMNAPGRRAAMRGEASLDTRQTQADALQGQIDTAGSTALQDATIAGTNRTLSGTSEARAAAAGATQRATQENTIRELSPGAKTVMGMGENTRPTAQEVQKDLYNEGLKGGAGDLKFPKEVEIELGGLRDRIKSVQDKINDGIAAGTLSVSPTEKNPDANAGFLVLEKQKRALEARFNAVASSVRAKNPALMDPGGMRDSAPQGKEPATDDRMQRILADMAKTGAKEATVNLDGSSFSVKAPGSLAEAAKERVAATDDPDGMKRWIKSKLMGVFDGTNKLREIAASNPNPKIRAAAKEMLEEEQSRAGGAVPADQPGL